MKNLVGYKFNIGDICVLKNSSENYQTNNKIVIGYHKERSWTWKDEEGKDHRLVDYLYSEDNLSWYPENTLRILYQKL